MIFASKGLLFDLASRIAFLFGIFNVAVAIWAVFIFDKELPWSKLLKGSAFAVLLSLILGFVFSERILSFAEVASYQDKVIFLKILNINALF